MKNTPLPTPVAPVRELATLAHEGTPRYGEYGHAAAAPVLVSRPDPRAAGGNVFVPRTGLTLP